jgi:hypothetical protein
MNFGCPTDSSIGLSNGLGNVFIRNRAQSTLTCWYQMGENRNCHMPSVQRPEILIAFCNKDSALR